MATVGVRPTGARVGGHRHVVLRQSGRRAAGGEPAGRLFRSYQRIVKISTAVAMTAAIGTVWVVSGYLLLGVVTGDAGAGADQGQFIAMSMLILSAALALRQVARSRLRALRRSGIGVCRMLAVGPAAQVNGLVDRLATETEHPYVVVGACVEGKNDLVEDVPQVSSMPAAGVDAGSAADAALVAKVLDALDRVDADAVCIAPGSQFSGSRLRALSWTLSERGVELVSELGMVDVARGRMWMRRAGAATMLHIRSNRFGGARRAVKVVLDRVLASLLLVVLSPLLTGVAVAVACSGPGPVLYRQARVGRGGQIFTMLKFRTMHDGADRCRDALLSEADADGPMFKMRDDPRVTRIGRMLRTYSLDELPQLVNVVRGEMSLVGPRPPLPEEVETYDQVEFRRLLAVPGMTGLWQVSGRSNLTWEETVRLDLRYVDNWSLGLDAQVLLKTGRAVVRGTGAY